MRRDFRIGDMLVPMTRETIFVFFDRHVQDIPGPFLVMAEEISECRSDVLVLTPECKIGIVSHYDIIHTVTVHRD